MATERITEQQALESVSTDASVLVIQVNDAGKEVLYETSLSVFVKALQEAGIIDGLQKSEDFEELKPEIIKNVSVSKEKISVEYLDGAKNEYNANILPIDDTVSKDDTVLFFKNEEKEDGETVITGNRVPLSDFISALKTAGINSELMTTEEFGKLKSSIVKNVTLKDNVISVVLLTGRKYEYTIDTTFFDSASVDDDGYLHITKAGKDVVPAILIPALKEKNAEITCKKVGYIFEEETE